MRHDARTLEHRLAWLLQGGTYLACAMIAIGLGATMMDMPIQMGQLDLVTIGILLLIGLPAIRVGAAAVHFGCAREQKMAVIGVTVLAIMAISVVVGATYG